MATAPPLTLVPVDEYLRSSWHPDKEYVDGVLVERSMPTIPHALLQVMLAAYFRGLEKEYRFKVLSEARTEIVERARYRIPDMLLCPTPLPKSGIVDVTPMAVFEILSPEDKMAETMERFRDYEHIGVSAIVQLDPVKRVAHRFEAGSLLETRFHSLFLGQLQASVPFDSEAIFEQLQNELNEEA